MRMSVKRRVGRRENHRAIEERRDSLPALRDIAIPQLELPAPLVAPVLVDVDQHVQTPIDLQLRMDVEVGVNLQESPGLDLMQTAAAEIGIGNQPVAAGQFLEI